MRHYLIFFLNNIYQIGTRLAIKKKKNWQHLYHQDIIKYFSSSISLNIAQINLYKSFDLLPRKRCSALYSIIQAKKVKRFLKSRFLFLLSFFLSFSVFNQSFSLILFVFPNTYSTPKKIIRININNIISE